MKRIKELGYKYFLCLALVITLMLGLFFLITKTVNAFSNSNQNIFAYTVKVRNTVENLDKIFERAEVNVNVMADSISNSYNTSKQQDKAYNLQYVEGINGLIKSVLTNSPGVDGCWFQLNADLPFSGYAYNWYEFRDDQFVNVKDQFGGTASEGRKITPEADPYYFDAINNQRPIWSDIYTDPDTKIQMMTISAPVYKEGTLVGVVGIDISIDNLQEILKNMQSALGNSELYLLNKKNKVVLSRLLSNTEESPNNDYPFLDRFNKNSEGPVEYYDNFAIKTAIKLTLSNDYKIVIALNNDDLYNVTNQVVILIYALFILLIISTIIVFKNSTPNSKM